MSTRLVRLAVYARHNTLGSCKILEFIALISVENGMKPLKNSSHRFREMLHYVRDKCFGLLSLHMAAYNDTSVFGAAYRGYTE